MKMLDDYMAMSYRMEIVEERRWICGFLSGFARLYYLW